MDRDFCNLTEEQIVIFDDIATRDFYNQDYNNFRSDQKFQMFAFSENKNKKRVDACWG